MQEDMSNEPINRLRIESVSHHYRARGITVVPITVQLSTLKSKLYGGQSIP